MDNKYSEDKYLSCDGLDSFFIPRANTKAIYEIEKKFGEELKGEYEDFLKKSAKFIKEFNINDDSILTALFIKTLLYRGTFSVSKNFKYDTRPKHETMKSGISVITGHACCRNISDFFADLENLLGQYATQYNCNMNYNREKYRIAIKRRCNHVINIIKDNEGNKLGFDVTNLYFLRFADAFNMEPIKGQSGSCLLYKPYYDYIEGNINDINDISKNLVMFEEESKKFFHYKKNYIIDGGNKNVF